MHTILEQTDEDHWDTVQMIKAAKTRSDSHYDSHFHPCTFSEGDLILIYYQARDKSGKWKFKSMWYGPYVIHRCLEKGSYLLADSDGHLLNNPCNGLYLKGFYS